MKKALIFAALLGVASFGFAGAAMADGFTGQGNIIWTFNNEGSDGGTGFLVQLQVDASNPTSGAGTSIFNVMSIQLSSGGTNATSITLKSTSSNTTGWQLAGPGNVNQCGFGALPFVCFNTASGITITGGVNSGVYTFLFDATGLGSAPRTGGVQALQGSLPGSNGSYAISQSFGVPEPASMTLLGLGLLGVTLLRRKRP